MKKLISIATIAMVLNTYSTVALSTKEFTDNHSPQVKEIDLNHKEPVKISRKNQQLPSALIAAIRKDLWEYREGFKDSYKDNHSHKVFFIDLNNDGVKEAIVYPIGGPMCFSRGCSIYIYTKIGKNYKRISAQNPGSGISGSRNGPSIGVMKSSHKGWRDLATRFFDYTTRTEKWSLVFYSKNGYTESSEVIISNPPTILEYSSGVDLDLHKVFYP